MHHLYSVHICSYLVHEHVTHGKMSVWGGGSISASWITSSDTIVVRLARRSSSSNSSSSSSTGGGGISWFPLLLKLSESAQRVTSSLQTGRQWQDSFQSITEMVAHKLLQYFQHTTVFSPTNLGKLQHNCKLHSVSKNSLITLTHCQHIFRIFGRHTQQEICKKITYN